MNEIYPTFEEVFYDPLTDDELDSPEWGEHPDENRILEEIKETTGYRILPPDLRIFAHERDDYSIAVLVWSGDPLDAWVIDH